MKNTKFLSTALLASLMVVGFSSCKDKEAEETMEDEMTMTDESMDDNMEGDSMEEETVMVGGAEMYPSKNIVENASQSADHTTLVAAVKAADLVGTLSSEGPFTVFAPTNAAFDALPKGTVETLLKPENKSKLAGILTYHVVPGNVDAIAVLDMIKNGNGKATAKTVAGAELTFTTADGNVYVTDVAGNKAQVTQADVRQSNGIIHVVNKVLMPTK
jgi:uncharacterized surface protein with fasciclin (FAS1) repeats